MSKRKRLKKPEGQAAQWSTPTKRIKGTPVFYKEVKSERLTLIFTPTAKEKLKHLASLNKLSMSEYLERWLKKFDELILPKNLVKISTVPLFTTFPIPELCYPFTLI